ncbi:hypothetical protein HDU99_002055 [Rhizoclosmatium hyalinum]|nr:hypothetical protein HDU99_002055 [Rhizoclosmatium hyalinum]
MTTLLNDALAQAQFAEKKWVWVHDKSEGYLAGWIIEEAGENAVVEFQDGSKRDLNINDTEKMNPPKFDKVEDMASLTYLNEASVIHNLRLRYLSNLIYTYSGLFLVAVNPYKRLPIYTDEMIKSYRSKKRSEMPPHIFAIADAAYYEMIQNKESQSILITGESGAGKTENTKKVIQYLAAIAPSNSSGKQGSLEQQIIQANPILEAFGNAQTIRNNNSSRFGKFIRLEFNPAGQICSANIERYLLEKSRVTHQTGKERNYHVFYQLMKGASPELKSKLLLEGDLNDYMFVKDSRKDIEGVDDSAEFKTLVNAMNIMGISSEEQLSFFRVISSILNLGNIQVVNDREDQAQLTELGHSVAEKVCHVLGISVPEFTKSLLKPKIKAGRDWVTQSRDVNQVLYSVEALARALYERMFGRLVDRINEAISNPSSKSSFIGVLDIAGFEIFEVTFEQLCINYTNEKLQQFFNHHMFIIEQEEYQREGIEWKFIDFGLDLQPTIDLIEKTSPIGVLSCLDEECVMPKATDRTFLDKLNGIWKGKSSKYEAPRFNTGFALHHYAGKVEYDINGWLDKNKDPLNENITKLLATSSDKFLETVLIQEQNAAANQAEILSRTQKRELLLTEQLAACVNDLEQKETELENTLKSKKALESELRSTVNTLKDQRDHCERIEKDRSLKEDQINELEFKLKLELETTNRLESDKRALEKEAKEIQSNLDNVSNEAADLLRHQNKLKSSITDLEERLETELEEKKRLEQKKASLEAEIQELNNLCSSLAKSKAELENALRRKESENSSLSEKLQQEIDERESSERQRRSLQSDLSATQTALESQYVERDLLKKSKLKLESELESLARLVEEKGSEENKQGELRKLREAELSDLKNQLSIAQNETEVLRKTSGIAQDKLNVELDTVRGELLTMAKLKSGFEKQAQELSTELEHVQEYQSRLEKSKRQLETDLAQSKSQNEELELALSELKLNKENLESRLSQISAKLEESESNASRLERERQSLSRQLASLNDDLEEEKMRTASLSTQNKRLGSELAEIRVQFEETSVAGEELSKKLTAKSSELDSYKEKYNQDVLAKSAEFDDLKRKTDSQILDLEHKTEDLERNCQNLEKTKSRLISESEDLKVELDRVSNSSRSIERLFKATESQLSSVNAAWESEKREKENLEGIVRRLQASSNSLTIELEEKNLQLSSLQKSKTDLESELRNLVNEIGDSGRSIHDLDKAKRRLESHISELESQLEDEQEAHRRSLDSKSQLEIQLADTKKKLESDLRAKESQMDEMRRLLMKEVNALGDQLEESQQQKADILKQKKKVEDQLEDLMSHAENTARGQSDLEKYKKKAEASLRDLQSRFEEEEKRRKNAEELSDRLEKKSNSLQTEVEALELQVESFERTKKNLEKKVADLTDEISGPAEDSKANLLDNKKKLEREIKALQQRLIEEEDVRSVIESEKLAAVNELELLRGRTRDVDIDKIEKLEESRRALMAAQRLTVQDLEDKTKDNENLEKQKRVLQAEIADLRATVENEIAAKCEESAARRKLAMDVKDLQTKLEAETLKSTDVNEIIASYKARIDTLSLQAESSELSKLKAEKMESNLRTQLREVEEHLKFVETDRRHLEDKVKILEAQVNDHNSKQEDDALELSDLKVSRKRLQEELLSLQERKSKEVEERDILLEQSKKKYQKEIKQLISDLDSEKVISLRAKEVNNDLEQELESVSNRFEAEMRLTAVLKKEKERLEAKVEEVIRSNGEMAERLDESVNQLLSAQSQLRDMKSNLEDSEAQRGLLEKSKKTLEARLEELCDQYSSADRSRAELTKSVMELDQKAVTLRDNLDELQDQANLAAEKLRRAEQQLVDSATDLSKERETSIELERSKVLLEKQVKELNSRVFELEAPEWMLRYALKLIEDHGSFLEFLQDGLNEREENSIIVKTEYISFLMGFLKEKIQQQAFRMMGNPELFSHLVTEAMRFDKTMLKVHQYDGYIDGQTYRGRVTDVFVEESQLFQCWLDIEREAAFYRYSEIMKVDPWNPSLSSAGLVKHTNSSEKLVDLLAVITDYNLELRCCKLFLDMLKFYNPSFNSDSDPLLNSVFAGIEKEYSKVIEQIESVVAEDCLQEIVESMWQYDSK